VAEAAAEVAAPAAEAAPAAFTPTAEMVNKGDVAWMMVSTAFVLMMSVPALALFYGGLVRAKNMLSVLMQVLTIVCVAALVWFGWGYSIAFTSPARPSRPSLAASTRRSSRASTSAPSLRPSRTGSTCPSWSS
jgi:ammonium transporter, Amt family